MLAHVHQPAVPGAGEVWRLPVKALVTKQAFHFLEFDTQILNLSHPYFCLKSKEFFVDLQDNISLSEQGDFPSFPKVGYLQKKSMSPKASC